MSAPHTPGPWRVEHVGQTWLEVGGDYQGESHAIVAFTHSEADARLIAAAPDLLAACELLQDFWANPDSGVEIPTILNAIKTATAKARGENA